MVLWKMTDKKVLAIITDFYLPEIGGVQTHVYDLARYASRSGYKVYVLTTTGIEPKTELLNGHTVVRLPYPKYAGFLGLTGLGRRYRKVLVSIQPDILHAHHLFSPSGIIAGKVAKSLGIPSVLTNHSIPVGYEIYKQFWNMISKALTLLPAVKYVGYYDAAIAVSKLAAEYLRIFYSGSIKIIPPPIDYEYFSITARKEEVGFNGDDKIVLFVGRLAPKKGLEFLLYAFRIISRLEENAKLVIVGPTDTPYYFYLKGLIGMLQLEKKVFFTGKVSREKLRKLYAAADVFVFPSYGGESFGIVALESMAAGTPIVTTLGGALAKYICRQKIGFLTGLDIKKFALAVVKLLRDPDLRMEMGKNARRFARLFSWERVFRMIEEIYLEVLRR